MSDKFERAMDQIGCSAVGYQDIDVCVPVTIKPFGEAGNVITHCEGNPVITQGCDHCPGKSGGVCRFTISQKLRVEVPVIFGAKAEVGEASVECGCAKTAGECEADLEYEPEFNAEDDTDM